MKLSPTNPNAIIDPNAKMPASGIPVNYKKLLMPRQCIMPAHGPISTLLNIWARLPYAKGHMRTGFNPYRKDDAVRRDEKYSKVSTSPYVWNGCAEAMVESLGIFHYSVESPSVTNEDMESLIDNSPMLGFLKKNHVVNIVKNDDKKEYLVRSGWLRSMNPTGFFGEQKCASIPNLVPVTDRGFFFIPRGFTDKLVPGYFKKKKRNDYEKYGLEFTCTDAYYDLYCHCCYNDNMVLGSQFGGIVTFGDFCPVITYSMLAERWGWSKAKVSRFFKAWSSLITVYSLGSNRGSVIYINRFISEQYASNLENTTVKDIIPTHEQIMALFVEAPREIEEKDAYTKDPLSPIPLSMQVEAVIAPIMERVGLSKTIYSYLIGRLTACFLKSMPCFKRVSRTKPSEYGIYTPPMCDHPISLIALGTPILAT